MSLVQTPITIKLKTIFFQCESVYAVNESQRCEFVKSVPDCYVEEGLFEYTIFLYCSFPFQLFPLGVTIHVSGFVLLIILPFNYCTI